VSTAGTAGSIKAEVVPPKPAEELVTITMPKSEARLLLSALDAPAAEGDTYTTFWKDDGVGKGVGSRTYHALRAAGITKVSA
jgi:hypothetical protein